MPVLTAAPSLDAGSEAGQADEQDLNAPPRAVRHRLQEERASITHKFSIAGHEGYITVGLYPNGQPGEIFIRMAKEGSTVSGLMDAFATSISLALQHGVPLKVLCEKFAHTRFEPSGWTGNEQIGYAKSLMDYIFRWLNLRFLSGEQLTLFAGLAPQAPQLPASPSLLPESDLEEADSCDPAAHCAAGRGGGQAAEPGDGGGWALRRRNRAGAAGRARHECAAAGRRSSALPGVAGRQMHGTSLAGPRPLPRGRRHARNVRHGRRAQLQCVRRDHGAQRQLLPLHELRVDERVQLGAGAARRHFSNGLRNAGKRWGS